MMSEEEQMAAALAASLGREIQPEASPPPEPAPMPQIPPASEEPSHSPSNSLRNRQIPGLYSPQSPPPIPQNHLNLHKPHEFNSDFLKVDVLWSEDSINPTRFAMYLRL